MSGADLGLTERRALATGGTKGIGAAVVACLRDRSGHGTHATRSA
jgi:NAD(P)-dependent dehydrogenase (short-subunit alcohol dehydrogenase family)